MSHEIEEFLRRVMQQRAAPEEEIVEAEMLDDSVIDQVARPVDAPSPGTPPDNRSSGKIGAKTGSLRARTEYSSTVKRRAGIHPFTQLLHNPNTLRAAVIMRELLDRPTHRW